ncbi:MAG TPA: PDZ domain-containing protein [Candidatus Acidoferrales bacterium]|nr:PDZ domain-containing protein [Candidatus Acidoferrales bacterium]
MTRNQWLAVAVTGTMALGVGALSITARAQSRDDQSIDERISEAQERALIRANRALQEAQGKLEGNYLKQYSKLDAAQIKLAEKLAAQAETIGARTQEKMAELQARLAYLQDQDGGWVAAMPPMPPMPPMPAMPKFDFDQNAIFQSDDGSGHLGISPEDVSADRAKDLKLNAPRGVYVSEVEEDSPASKAGLKSGDVITDFNGQHVEGVVQFRRMVRETPPGRSVQITVWRDGRSQNVTATLDEGGTSSMILRAIPRVKVAPTPAPRAFAYSMPEGTINNFFSIGPTPTLGISGEDLEGQLGSYFGAPDGEGILVREVMEDSPASKAGMKAGDVITKINGDRVRNLGEMREKLRDKRDEKTIQVTVLRKGAEQTLTVEPKKPQTRTITRGRSISM